MNKLPPKMNIGKFGELFVQLRLLQYGIQAAPPLCDTGNDLIAVNGNVFRAIQVKTSMSKKISINKLPELYHLLAIVHIDRSSRETDFSLDKVNMYLLKKGEFSTPVKIKDIKDKVVTRDHIAELFSECS